MTRKVYIRKDGRYEARYPYGYKEDGSINYKSVYGKTIDEVNLKRDIEIETKKNSNDLLILDKSYLGYYINAWLKSAKIRCKKSTYSNYQYMVNARIVSKFAKVKKKNITSEMVDSYTTDLLNQGLLPKTVKDIVVVIKQILNLAGIKLDVSLPKIPKKEIQIFKIEEQVILERFLLDNINTTTLGIYFCLYTGLRIGELCALKWENIDIKNKKVKINKTITRIKNPSMNSDVKTVVVMDEPKSSSSIREIPIPDFIIPILRKISKDVIPTDFFVTGNGSFVETRTYFNRYKKILGKINLSNYNFHALRHTFATRCVEKGFDPKTLSEILGHSSVKITLERYVHPNYENKVKMMNQLRPMC